MSKTDYMKYHYTGPHYFNGIKMAEYNDLYTQARSFKEARKNFLYKVANGDIISRYDIVDRYITLVDDDNVQVPEREIYYCEYCGTQLSDAGYCPRCVETGEEDIMEITKQLNEIV
jgi:hypothetical protein